MTVNDAIDPIDLSCALSVAKGVIFLHSDKAGAWCANMLTATTRPGYWRYVKRLCEDMIAERSATASN